MIEMTQIGLESAPGDATKMILDRRTCDYGMYTSDLIQQVFLGASTGALHNIYKSGIDALCGTLNLTEPA